MSRRVRQSSGTFAVLLSLALHGLLALGLLVQPHRSPAKAPPPSLVVTTTPDSAAEESEDCHFYLIPEPPSKPRPRMVLAPPAPPAQELLPPINALPAHIPATDVAPPLPMAPAVLKGGQGTGSAQGTSQKNNGMVEALFGLPAPAQKIVYVLDRSSSMGQNSLLKRASQELLASLEKLAATAQFQILVYNSNVEPLPRPLWQWRYPSAENLKQVALALQALPAEGGTDHLPALRRAIGLRPDLIFFVTDADDLTEEQVRLATEWNAGKAVICTIELNLDNRPYEFKPLQRLARANGGRYRAVDLRLPPDRHEVAPQAN